MASKKFKLVLIVAMIVFMQTTSIAQTNNSWGWNWKDSSLITPKKRAQYNEFLNNQFPYPPKPRNQWELGFSIGNSYIIGDRSIANGYNGGIAGSISARKALDHMFSIRGSYTGSIISIPGSTSQGLVAAKNYTHALGADVIMSLNTASNYRGNPKTNIYLLGGYSLIATKVQTKQGNDYRTLYYPQANLITTTGGVTVNGRKGWGLLHGFNVGFGMAFKVSNKVNLGFEQKFIIPLFANDYLDGNSKGNTNDKYSFSTLRVNINL
jgi:opacity protein-like surface antigen